ncbi:unnamed protein product [Cylicocyclus nassatus]|uniref:Uncharacterized protein n=1 Tax=Cylicocyclus nassatus TaxID=53992 RepID=A0AA36H7U6_CYLNA|nr:unnamed protein product [Cylicocyclus nassatus]
MGPYDMLWICIYYVISSFDTVFEIICMAAVFSSLSALLGFGDEERHPPCLCPQVYVRIISMTVGHLFSAVLLAWTINRDEERAQHNPPRCTCPHVASDSPRFCVAMRKHNDEDDEDGEDKHGDHD